MLFEASEHEPPERVEVGAVKEVTLALAIARAEIRHRSQMFCQLPRDGALLSFFGFAMHDVNDPPPCEEVVDVPVDFFIARQMALNTFFEAAEGRADVCVVAGL